MIPLIYLVGAGVASLLFASTKGFGLWKKGKTMKISILGPVSSGKSTLQAFFRNFVHDNTPTTFSGETLPQVTIEKDGKKIILAKGLDVSGDDDAIRELYELEIDKCDWIIFIFDANKFMNDDLSRKRVIALLGHIDKKNSKMDSILNDFNKSGSSVFSYKKPIILIGSHVDILLKDNDNENSRKNKTKEIKNYLHPFLTKTGTQNVLLANLTNKKELEAIKSELFK